MGLSARSIAARRWSSRCSASASSTACRSTPTWCSTCAACPTRISCRRCARGPGATARWSRSWSRTRRRASSCDRLEDYLRFVVPHYVAEGKSYLTIGHRLHRRPAPLGDDCGAARAGAGRHRRRARARAAPGHRACVAAWSAACDHAGGRRHRDRRGDDRRRRRHARAARHRAGQRGRDDRRRPAAVHRRVDRLARRRQRRARGDRAGDRARARRGRACCC